MTAPVLHLHRLRQALTILLAATTDPGVRTDPTWIRQAATALEALATHAYALPARTRAGVAVVVDPAASPPVRRQALAEVAQRLRIEPGPAADPTTGPDAAVLHYPDHQVQGRLFDPA